MFVTVILFLVVLSLLVFVHELGHFWAARRSGMKVEEFGFGFPPRLLGFQRSGGRWATVWGHGQPKNPEATVYSVNWIPLGGFVRILGENGDSAEDPRSFANGTFAGRFLTLVAGVTMNVVLAWALFSFGYVLGLPVAVSGPDQLPSGARFENPEVAIVEVFRGQEAEAAGLKPGDVVVSVDGQRFQGVGEVQAYVRNQSGKVFSFEVRRQGQLLTLSVPSKPKPKVDEGPTGISLAQVGTLRYPWYQAPLEGLKTTANQLLNILVGFYQLLTSRLGLDSLGGPVKIAQLTGQVASMGAVHLLQFTAFLSLNLAVLNVLPLPALDGGRILFLAIEKLRGRRNNRTLEQAVNAVGFALLILLMAAVTVNDIFRS